MLVIGTILAAGALTGLIVALASRLKISPGLEKTGPGPASWRHAVEMACGLTSAAALFLSLVIFIRFGSGPGRLVWDPGMEINPFFGVRKTVDRPVLPPGKVIRETTVGASAEDQQVDLGPVTVIIPAGTLSKPETVSASQAPGELFPPFGPAAGTLAFVDIRIGEMTRFEKPLTLEFSVKTAGIDPDLPPEQQFQAVYFDEEERSWKRVPFSVDPAGRKISIRTDHLTVYWIGNLFSLDGKYCTVYFLPSEIRSVNRKYENAAGIASRERLPLSIIRDTAFFMDAAYDGYGLPADPLPLPAPKVSVLAFLGSNASWFERSSGKAETYTGTWSGWINVDMEAVRNSADMSEELRGTCAHELFHLVQREKYGITAMDLYNFRQAYFWLDAAAEYAACTLAWRTRAELRGRTLGPVPYTWGDLDFFKETLVSPGDPHRYQAALFIEFILARYKLEIAALLDIPELDRVFSVSFGNYMETIDPQLSLAWVYEAFARFLVFDAASPWAMNSQQIFVKMQKLFHGTLLPFMDAAGNILKPVIEMDRDLAAAGHYTSDLAGFRPDTPCAIDLEVQQPLRWVSAGVFSPDSGKPVKVVTLSIDNPATLYLKAQDTLVLLYSPFSAGDAVRVHLKARLPAASLQVRAVNAVTAAPVTATVKVTPANGAASEKEGADVLFQGLTAGDVQLNVSARGYVSRSERLTLGAGLDRPVERTVELEIEKSGTATMIIKVQDAKTGNAVVAQVVVTPQGNGRTAVKNGSSVVFSGLAKGDYTMAVSAKGYQTRYGNFFIDPGDRLEIQTVCKLVREEGPVTRPTVQPPPAVETTDSGPFDERMLQQRNDELRRLSDEIGQIWNKLQDCCSNQSHSGTPPDGMVAIMAVQKFGQCRLACRNCGMAFSTMASIRSNGKTYYQNYRERVEYYDTLLRQAPPAFWETHEYEEYGGLNIIKKR
jgi:hypothetical protein